MCLLRVPVYPLRDTDNWSPDIWLDICYYVFSFIYFNTKWDTLTSVTVTILRVNRKSSEKVVA